MAEIVANFELENNEISADMELSNDNNIEADFVIYSTGTTWGNISGDITNQTDLSNALTELQTNIQNEATTRANKDSLLDNDISTINGKINGIEDTLDGFGDIVTHNVDEFATASQGQLAESSLQSGDNISELVNDSGYITNNALSGYATESWVIGQGYTTNEGTVTSVNNVLPDSNGNVTIVLPDTQVQADWNESDSTSKAYIKNKPSIPSSASDVGALPDSTKYGKSIDIALNTTDYKLTISLKDQDGTVLNSKVVDFPLESVVVSGAYDDNTKKVILTLQNGSTIEFSVADLISGLQEEITSSNKLDSDLVDDTNQTHKFVTTSEKQTWNNKQDNISDLSTIRSGANAGATAVQPSDLSTVATSGSYNDLSDKPTIPSAQIQSDWNQSNNTAVDYIKNKPTIPAVPTNVSAFNNDSGYITSADLSGYATESWVGQQGYITGIDSTDVTTALGYTPVNPSNLSTVATSGSYNDLTNKPTIPSATSDLTNDSGYITGITSNDVTTALGYTPYSSTNPSGYTSNVGTVTSVNNTQPDSNGNVSLTIPDTTNFVTTNTDQTISNRKTFLGEKAIYFKQNETTNKLGFTLFNPSDTELGALEFRPNTINGANLLNLNTSYSNGTFVGLRYWGTKNINIVAPKPDTTGNYYIPVNITDGTNTVTANNKGAVDISSIIPTATSDLTNDSGYITGITSSDVITALGYTPYNSTNPNGYITGITSSDVTNALGYTPCQADLSNCTKPYIVETYGHYDEHGFGTESWYRLWSDGFLEQGGKITPSADANAISITFLKTYDYLPTVVTTVNYNQGVYTPNTSNCTNRNANLVACSISNTSTSGFVVNRGGTNWDINWRATGYVPIVA